MNVNNHSEAFEKLNFVIDNFKDYQIMMDKIRKFFKMDKNAENIEIQKRLLEYLNEKSERNVINPEKIRMKESMFLGKISHELSRLQANRRGSFTYLLP